MASHFSGNNILTRTFPTTLFSAGRTLKGVVIVQTKRFMKGRELVLSLHGKESATCVRLSRKHKFKKHRYYKAERDLYRVTVPLRRFTTEWGFRPGKYEVPFEIELPGKYCKHMRGSGAKLRVGNGNVRERNRPANAI
jgi:hypothetical protein